MYDSLPILKTKQNFLAMAAISSPPPIHPCPKMPNLLYPLLLCEL